MNLGSLMEIDLPNEIFLCIFDHCTIWDIMNFGQTCKEYRFVVINIINFIIKTRKKNNNFWEDYSAKNNLTENYSSFCNYFYAEIKNQIIVDKSCSYLEDIATNTTLEEFSDFYRFYRNNKYFIDLNNDYIDTLHNHNLIYYFNKYFFKLSKNKYDLASNALKFNINNCTNFVCYIGEVVTEFKENKIKLFTDFLIYNTEGSSNYLYYMIQIIKNFNKHSLKILKNYLSIQYMKENNYNILGYIINVYEDKNSKNFKQFMNEITKEHKTCLQIMKLKEKYVKIN
ncbi:hypothetical protein CPAV1605_1078 [seawater metagenome]|uniref:F-box domain-containing protein n=1 Tax=seawater metagenome TaxID=1561972 RepID=A0A5E8CJV5_9ZZZZ